MTFFALSFPAFASDAVVQPSIAVVGVAEAKIAPDEAVMNVEVYTEKRDLQAAKKEQDEKVRKLLAIAKKQGVSEEQIRTLYANVNPIYDYLPNTNKPKFRAYGLSNNIQITTQDLTLVGPLMDALVEANFDRIQGVQFGLKNQRDEQDKLMKAALLNAKAKATNMVSALDAKLGKPITITESGSYNPPPVMMAKAMRTEMAMATDAGGSMPTYTPAGLIEIQQTVNVTFAIQ
jgi:uncharacterized protein YggE